MKANQTMRSSAGELESASELLLPFGGGGGRGGPFREQRVAFQCSGAQRTRTA